MWKHERERKKEGRDTNKRNAEEKGEIERRVRNKKEKYEGQRWYWEYKAFLKCFVVKIMENEINSKELMKDWLPNFQHKDAQKRDGKKWTRNKINEEHG